MTSGHLGNYTTLTDATRQKRRFKRTTDSEHALPIALNLMAQDFMAGGLDRKWGADISYIWTAEGWLYLAIVLDLFSRPSLWASDPWRHHGSTSVGSRVIA